MAKLQKTQTERSQSSRRLELQILLETILGSRNVYYQPPESVKMKYPAIVYERNDIERIHADDIPYLRNVEYMITVIDKDPDSPIVDAVSRLPKCCFNRHFTADNLNHDIFTIFF